MLNQCAARPLVFVEAPTCADRGLRCIEYSDAPGIHVCAAEGNGLPLQDRVTPDSEIIINPARGLFMGSRDVLHKDHQTLGEMRWALT